MERDLNANPYSPEERRVVDFFWQRGVGGGDDPIGFMLASYAYIASELNAYRWRHDGTSQGANT